MTNLFITTNKTGLLAGQRSAHVILGKDLKVLRLFISTSAPEVAADDLEFKQKLEFFLNPGVKFKSFVSIREFFGSSVWTGANTVTAIWTGANSSPFEGRENTTTPVLAAMSNTTVNLFETDDDMGPGIFQPNSNLRLSTSIQSVKGVRLV